MDSSPSIWMPTRAQERRSILAISGPLIGAYLAEMGMVITDMIIVGRLGSIELAAVGLGGDWFYVLLLIGIGVLSIVGVLIAQARGANKEDKVLGYLQQGIVVATVLAVPISLLSWFLSPMLGITDQNPEVLQRLDEYMHAVTLSVWPGLMYVVFRNYLTAYEDTKPLLLLTLSALVLNAAINIVLVHGKLGFPALGVTGAGLGTTIVHWLIFIVLTLYLSHKRWFRLRDLWSVRGKGSGNALREICTLGYPIGAAHLLEGGMFTVAAVMMGVLSAAHLAAQQLVYTLLYGAISIAIGIGDAAKIRVAYALGKNSPPAMIQATNQCLLFGGTACLLIALVLWVFPDLLIGIFLNVDDAGNAAAITVALTLTVFTGLFQIVDGLNVIIANALRGLRDTRTPMWATLIGYWLFGVGIAWVLCFRFSLGAAGIWYGMMAGVTFSCALMIWKFYSHTSDAKKWA